MGTEAWPTIHDVAASMGLALTDEQAWEIGAAIANAYNAVERTRPIKELRPKKRGQGSHCFATYPPSWVPYIQAAIRTAGAQRDRQGRFPF